MRNFKFKTYRTFVPLIVLASLLFFASCNTITRSDLPENNAGEQEQTENTGPYPDGDSNINQSDGNAEQLINEKSKDTLKRVGIYDGRGSWEISRSAYENFFNHYDIEYGSFDEQDAVSLDLGRHFDVILFPGGFAAEYKNYISDHDNILNFIAEGGSFIGSCAGAYYASDILRWQGSDYQYPLSLFDGKGIGPLSGLIGWGEAATFILEPQHPANDSFSRSLDFYYFDGPYFEPYKDLDDYEVLATYAKNDKPAVIAGRYGKGKYLLLGPHPEIGGYTAESPGFNVEGDDGAKWPWLYSSLLWFFKW